MTCRRWRRADPGRHGSARLVCILPRGHRNEHCNNRGQHAWFWDNDRNQPRRDWFCNGWVGGRRGRCGLRVRASADEARLMGWKIGWRNGVDDPLCPQCGRPDPATTKLLEELARSVA